MIILDSLIIGGIRFVLDKIATAVDREMNDESSMREELLAAQMRLELGEIDDEELAALESDLMARLRQARESRRQESEAAGDGPAAVDADAAGDAHDGGAGPGGALSFDPRRHTIGVEVTFAGEEPE